MLPTKYGRAKAESRRVGIDGLFFLGGTFNLRPHAFFDNASVSGSDDRDGIVRFVLGQSDFKFFLHFGFDG